MIVEVKLHKRNIDATRAGATIAHVQDVGGIPSVVVASPGFSDRFRMWMESGSIRDPQRER